MILSIYWIKAVGCDDIDIGILRLGQIAKKILKCSSLQNWREESASNWLQSRACVAAIHNPFLLLLTSQIGHN